MKTEGSTLQCFTDFISRIGHDDLLEKRRILAQILCVEENTVRRWITGANIPIGMSMIGLRYYLDYLGYRVSEITQLPRLLQDVSRLLTFRVMTLEDMAKLVGCEEYPGHLLALLRGARGFSAEREAQLQDIVDAYQQELAEKLLLVPKLVAIKDVPLVVEVSGTMPGTVATKTVSSTNVSPQTANKSMRRDERFKGLTLNLLDFARFYTDREVPEEVRDQLRTVVGQQNIFDLKNLLARLCSSKAYNNQ